MKADKRSQHKKKPRDLKSCGFSICRLHFYFPRLLVQVIQAAYPCLYLILCDIFTDCLWNVLFPFFFFCDEFPYISPSDPLFFRTFFPEYLCLKPQILEDPELLFIPLTSDAHIVGGTFRNILWDQVRLADRKWDNLIFFSRYAEIRQSTLYHFKTLEVSKRIVSFCSTVHIQIRCCRICHNV